MPLAEIARSENISFGYLEQLLASLRRAALVESTRGVRGGYQLTAAPDRVTVGQVLRALEGPIAPAECASEAGNHGFCGRQSDCPSKLFWENLRDSIARVLDETTLADLYSGDKVKIP